MHLTTCLDGVSSTPCAPSTPPSARGLHTPSSCVEDFNPGRTIQRPPAPIPAPTANVWVPQGVAPTSWFGFEQRIQARRFSVLLEHLRVAIAARDVVRAREALEEARQLRPSAPELDELERQVASITGWMPAVGREMLWSRGARAVLILVLGVSMIAGLDRRPAGFLIESSATLRMDATPATIRMVPASAPESDHQPKVSAAELELRSHERRPIPKRQAPRSGEVSDDVVVPQLRDPVRAVANETIAPPPSTPLATPTSAVTPPVSAPPPVTAVPAATAESTIAQEFRIAEVLRRYARAYSALDARAAREIWPTVDERALARAFESLASQTVSLKDCEINVDGTTADASCGGYASYVAKVGSGEPRTQPRAWRFELRRDGDEWKIATVDTRAPARANR